MPASETQANQRWFPVARLLRPQGRRGELLADLLTDLPEIFVKDASFRRAPNAESADTAQAVILQDCWRPQGRNAGRVVLKFVGVDSISAAEALNGDHLFLPESALPTLEADTFLVRDLLGASLYDADTLVGTVVDLQFPVAPDGRTRLPDAADLLVVKPQETSADAAEILIPFIKAWLTETDLPNKRIVMNLPPGLHEATPQSETLP